MQRRKFTREFKPFGATAEACRSPISGGSRRRPARTLTRYRRINRSIRCSPQSAPSANTSRHTRLAP
jgi:hypothetical protein